MINGDSVILQDIKDERGDRKTQAHPKELSTKRKPPIYGSRADSFGPSTVTHLKTAWGEYHVMIFSRANPGDIRRMQSSYAFDKITGKTPSGPIIVGGKEMVHFFPHLQLRVIPCILSANALLRRVSVNGIVVIGHGYCGDRQVGRRKDKICKEFG